MIDSEFYVRLLAERPMPELTDRADSLYELRLMIHNLAVVLNELVSRAERLEER